MKKTAVFGGLSFCGAATACVLVAASYPIAIWGVGFAACYKVYQITHQSQSHPEAVCPLLQAAATTVDREEPARVVAKNHRQLKQNQSIRPTHSA